MKRHGLTDNKELPSFGRRKFLQASTSLPMAIPTAITQTLNPQSRPPKAKSVVLLWLWGAPSHIDTWDPKPDAPTDFRGPFSTIATRTAGIHFSELLPHLSERTNLFSLVQPKMAARSNPILDRFLRATKDMHNYLHSFRSAVDLPEMWSAR